MAKRSKAPAAASDTGLGEFDTMPNTIEVDESTVVEPAVNEEEILAALEAADPTPEVEVVEMAVEEVSLDEADEDAVLAALEADETAATPAAKSKRKSSPKTPAAPIVTVQMADVLDHMDEASFKAALDSINAKKVAEKASNLVQAITTGKKLSGFTKLAVKTLLSDGRISGKRLVEAYQADGKSIGTARAQSQQMTALFKTLGIAQPDPANPRELVAANNGLVRELEKLAA